MKIIFLDIDGVLNTENYITAFWNMCEIMELKRPQAKLLRREMMRDDYGNRFDPMAVKSLNLLIESTGAKIVLSSSWRLSGIEWVKEMWTHRNLPGEVIDITPCLMMKRDKDLGFNERAERGNEIKHWLNQRDDVEGYIIIDDDTDMLEEQRPYFINTHEQYGLTLMDVDRGIKILS